MTLTCNLYPTIVGFNNLFEQKVRQNLVLNLEYTMSENGQTHFKNLALFAPRFLKYIWPFWDIMLWRTKGSKTFS